MKNDKSRSGVKDVSSNEDLPKNEADQYPPMTESSLVSCQKISSERYQAFVESIEEGVYEVDIHGNYLYFNQALPRILGYPPEEIQFQSFTKFMDDAYARKGFETFGEIYRTGRGVTDIIWETRTKEGQTRILELSANLIKNELGEKIGFRGIARDITEKFRTQKALEKSERRFRTLLDFVPYPVVVYTTKGTVTYLNPAFTEIFGWSLAELKGKTVPFVAPGLEHETDENVKKLFRERVILRYETRRMTKDGRILDVVFRAAVFKENASEPSGILVILRDITQEKRMARNNEALLRISMALPEYTELEDLLDYINSEVKRLLDVEGSLVMLLDKENNEIFFKSLVLDDSVTEKRMKEVRFPAHEGIAGKVIRTGEAVVVNDTAQEPGFSPVVNIRSGSVTRSMLDVPLRSKDRIIGVLCALNKQNGTFDQTDTELLSLIAGTVALSVENARFSEELLDAYKEVSSLNRAKDKVINHLSHELKTPLSVLSASLNILTKRLSNLPKESWEPTIDRAKRNLDRVLDLQYQVEDIMRERHYDTQSVLNQLLETCTDELEALVAEEIGETPLIDKIRSRINEVFIPKESKPQDIRLNRFVAETLDRIKPHFSHREIDLITLFEPTPLVHVPKDVLDKIVVALIKNAVENTPDQGKIEITVQQQEKGSVFMVRDFGVGITDESQRRIFEGFFTTQETMDYSSRRPYDFNAGGKGVDLLRARIFSERYGFKLQMSTDRCGHIPTEKDRCPGDISLCEFCENRGGCFRSGGTTFVVFFPEGISDEGGPSD